LLFSTYFLQKYGDLSIKLIYPASTEINDGIKISINRIMLINSFSSSPPPPSPKRATYNKKKALI